MRYRILTLTPDIHGSFLSDGVLARASKKGMIQFEVVPLRNFSDRSDKRVDDKPTGGGQGMVIRADVTARALNQIRTSQSYTVFLTPSGKVFNNAIARDLSTKNEIIFVCGRYEGFDSRVVEKFADLELSLGDFVISGGDLAAQIMIDAISRFIPGVLGNVESAGSESFEDGLLEGPVYTHPFDFDGASIPKVLLSGDHKKIAAHRRREKVAYTALRRPDLIYSMWESLSEAEKRLAQNLFRSGK